MTDELSCCKLPPHLARIWFPLTWHSDWQACHPEESGTFPACSIPVGAKQEVYHRSLHKSQYLQLSWLGGGIVVKVPVSQKDERFNRCSIC